MNRGKTKCLSPRENMMVNGTATLSDAELLAIIVRNGRQGQSAIQLAHNILGTCEGRLLKLSHCLRFADRINNAISIQALSEEQVCALRAAFELGRRIEIEREERTFHDRIQTPEQAVELIRKRMTTLEHEEMWALYLSANGTLLARERISEGGISCSTTDHMKILRPAIEHMARSVILLHNHPSSSEQPSAQDIMTTSLLCKSMDLLGIQLLDHIVVGNNTFYSMAQNNKMPNK